MGATNGGVRVSGRVRAPDVIAVAEAARAPATSVQRWLEHVLDAVRPMLDDGLGVMGCVFDPAIGDVRLEAMAIRGAPRGFRRALLGAVEHHAHFVAPLFERGCATIRDVYGDTLIDHPAFASFRALGQRDSLGLAHMLPEGRGVLLGGAQRRERATTVAERRRWRRVLAHVAAGLRARDGRIAAVLRSDGRVEHADHDAKLAPVRAALRDATIRAERARGRLRHADPDAALELWSAMVGGEYSLVDHFESDGRRYVVARRCGLRSSGAPGLTSRELVVAAHVASGRPLKLVAYELGLAISTVATHLARAMDKLRVGSRSELAAALGPLAVAPGQREPLTRAMSSAREPTPSLR